MEDPNIHTYSSIALALFFVRVCFWPLFFASDEAILAVFVEGVILLRQEDYLPALLIL